MRLFFFFFICVLVFSQCSKPIASFLLDKQEYLLTDTMRISNNSSSSLSYEWKINDEVISQSKDLSYPVLESGRYKIHLTAKSDSKTSIYQEEVIVQSPKECIVHLVTTHGDLILELDENTPVHLNNFTSLVEAGFYNGLIFHRVIEGFMVQGGDNKLRASSNDSFEEPKEIPHEIRPDLIHVRGALAAARMPDEINPEKKSSGSQFYIVDGTKLTFEKLKRIRDEKLFDYTDVQIQAYLKDGGTPQLDGEYTVFGMLISGFETLDKIASTITDKFDKPQKEVRIIKAKMLN